MAYGFSEPLIHSHNKNGVILEEALAQTRELMQRCFLVILGDSLGGKRHLISTLDITLFAFVDVSWHH